MTSAIEIGSGDVVTFWREAGSEKWFTKDAAFDRAIADRFGELHAKAAAGHLADWASTPEGALALVLLLDQFSRNLYRNDARAYAQDEMARSCAGEAIQRGDDLGFIPVQRQFLYMPFEHSEALADQDYAVELMGSLENFEETAGLGAWAEKHRDIIRRFGRFPHRNALLGRESTPDEAEFLKRPGAGF